jgi:hypothetical protein
MNYNNKRNFFSEVSNVIYLNDMQSDKFNLSEIKMSNLKTPFIIDEIKAIRVIELDNIESFSSYTNYDYFLIFKVKCDYYFCETALAKTYGIYGLIKLLDFNQHLRKEKMKKIEKLN